MKTNQQFIAKLLSLIGTLVMTAITLQSQSWETLSNVPEKLTFPVAVAVNGKIHVMGGGGTNGATTNHYEYDPLTDIWTKRASVPYKAQQPAGAANGNTIHFFGGGYPNSGTPLKNHYVYDFQTDKWTKATDLTQARAIGYGVELNGQVYSLAGQGVADWCDVYDETTSSWIRKRNLPDSKFWYGAHISTHGSIFRFCGGGYTAPVSTANRYDPITDIWTTLPPVPIAIHGLNGAAIGDKIYLVGGYHDFVDSDEVWIYDINSKTYEKGVSLPVGRTYHNVVAVDNCIYSIGGNNAIDTTIGVSLIRFCPQINSSTNQKTGVAKPQIDIQPSQLHIHFNETDQSIWKIRITDTEGRIIYSESINSSAQNQLNINTNPFAPSYYQIQLYNSRVLYNYPFTIVK